MEKPRLSWQGIGVSSNPNQKEEPLSVHLLAYLQESAKTADEHVIIVADDMQVSNYIALNGLDEIKARKLALRKGRKKAKNLERICKANKLNNVKILRFNNVWGQKQETIFNQIRTAYQNDLEIKQAVDSIIPKRLKQRAKSGDLANYALKEIALILSVPGTKFGHEKEKAYDVVAKNIHRKYRIGKYPLFQYSELGLELVPDNGLKIEPYSSLVSNGRILLTDSKRRFLAKLKSMPKKAYGKVRKQFESVLEKGNNHFGERLYDKVIKPTRFALNRPKRMALATAAAITIISALSGSGLYVNADAKQIRQKHINDIPGFVFSGNIERSRKAVDDKIQKANQEIQGKYFIKDYFK